MSPYLVRGIKAVGSAAGATVAGRKLWDGLYGWAGRSADAQEASGGSEWFAGFTQYVLADVVGVLFVPAVVWAGLRLVGVKGAHLAVLVCGILWSVFSAPRLVDAHPGPAMIVWCVALQAGATGAAMALHTASTSSARR